MHPDYKKVYNRLSMHIDINERGQAWISSITQTQFKNTAPRYGSGKLFTDLNMVAEHAELKKHM